MSRRLPPLASALAVLALGCAHKPLSGSELDGVQRPAIFARIEEGAGPKSHVFRDDGSYAPKLRKLDAKEADRRLAAKLAGGATDPKTGQVTARSITRFEVADTLRAQTLAFLPQELPWTRAVNPAEVASALEAFLVEEVPANPPDYEKLVPLGVDWVVEIVVEEYGMRSEKGRAGTYVVGFARMFRVDGGEAYFRRFFSDDVKAGLEHLEPFAVAKNPMLFRERLRQMLIAISEQLSKDLNPPDRRGGPPLPAGEQDGGEAPAKKQFQKPKEQSDELPDPL